MKEYFHSHGTNGSYVRTNPEAVQLWLEELRSKPNPAHDNEPLEWIKNMTKVKSEDRPSALQLTNLIRECEGGFCGTCCIDDEVSTESSYQGSVLDEQIASEIKNTDNVDDAMLTGAVQKEMAAQLLIKNGFDVNAEDFGIATNLCGETALRWAASRGHEAVVSLLLEKGAILDLKDSLGQTELHQAASSGHEAVVRLLLEKGADAAAKDGYGYTALHRAAIIGHEAVARSLLEKGANLDVKDRDGRMPLHWAAFNGHELMVLLLLENGAKMGGKIVYWTPLHAAAFNGHEAVVRLLVKKGADIAAKDKYGRTALHLATGYGAPEWFRKQ
jgi:ankyrin repeat protein